MAWISYMAQTYWTGHLAEMVSGIGDVSGTVSSSVVERASDGSAEHQLVVYARILTTVLLFSMAGWGLLRRRRRGIEDRVLVVLITVPIGLVLLQSYGGEIALRVYLFALAPACVLAALALFPHPASAPLGARPRRRRRMHSGSIVRLLRHPLRQRAVRTDA